MGLEPIAVVANVREGTDGDLHMGSLSAGETADQHGRNACMSEPDLPSRGVREVELPAGDIWPAIVDAHHDALAVIGDAEAGAEG